VVLPAQVPTESRAWEGRTYARVSMLTVPAPTASGNATSSQLAAAITRADDDKFHDLVARLNAIVWEADGEEYRMTFVSDKSRELLGYDPEQWLNEPEFWERHLHPEDRDRTIALTDAAIRDERAIALEYRFRAADGEYRWMSDVIGIAGGPGNRRLIGVMIDITDRKLLEARLAHLAFHDTLTRLPNRARLERHLEDRLRAGSGNLAILFIDLDDFKTINDSLGHAAGDELLTYVAERLSAETREDDLVARLGGDEFVVAVQARDRSQVLALADRLLKQIRRPYQVRGRSVATRASIGVVFDEGSADSQTLLRDADVAMYRAKQAGKGRVVVGGGGWGCPPPRPPPPPPHDSISRRTCAQGSGSASSSWAISRSSTSGRDASWRSRALPCPAGRIPGAARSRPRRSFPSPSRRDSSGTSACASSASERVSSPSGEPASAPAATCA
jgi:diguanylate cyclase (GGDEF)-like protein/PAS domain S-box-containing protein